MKFLNYGAMKKILIYGLYLLAAAVLTAGCIKDEAAVPALRGGDRLTLQLPEPQQVAGTRAATAAECRIGSLYVLVYRGGALDRARLAGMVFSDGAALADLNALVHPAVVADFAAWAERQAGDYVILESAILFEAGLRGAVDRTVAVLAPLELRSERTCRRVGCVAEAVRRRIAAQADDDTLCAAADFTLVNILEEELEPAVAALDRRFRYEAQHR